MQGIVDADDVIAMAANVVKQEGLAGRYDLIVVDEAQDLTLMAASLLGRIAQATGAQLLILGDGHQSIYPGSYRLADAGIDVRGRARVLTKNYRNAADVLIAAEAVQRSVISGADVLDSGETDDAPQLARIDPGRVVVEECDDEEGLQLSAVGEIERLVSEGANCRRHCGSCAVEECRQVVGAIR